MSGLRPASRGSTNILPLSLPSSLGGLRIPGFEFSRLRTQRSSNNPVQIPNQEQTSVLWNPLPGPQTLAFHSEADELYYGGQVGGGKTDLLLGLAGTGHYRSIIFRGVLKEFREMIERSREIFDPVGSYNETTHIWRLTHDRIIELATIDHPKEVKHYKGRPHDFYGWDEVPEFSEYMFRFINAWNRSVRPGQRCRVVATGNPPTTPEGQWVIKYWGPWLDEHNPNPAKPGELRWFSVIDGRDVECDSGTPFEHKGEMIYPRSRTFIPASLSDNPYLDRTGYRGNLQNLPEPIRSQMLYGDFAAGLQPDAYQVIPTAWVKAAMARWTPDKPACTMTALGVDVARGGEAQTVLAPRYRQWFAPLLKFPGKQTPDGPSCAALVVKVVEGRAQINIDVIGCGGSPYDSLRGMNHIRVAGMNASEASDATDRHGIQGFPNKRSEWWWKFREALDPEDGDELQLPPDPELLADLCAPRFEMRSRGWQVESKDEIVKRLGRSPDCGDAVVYAHANEGIVNELVTGDTRPPSILGSAFGGGSYKGGW